MQSVSVSAPPAARQRQLNTERIDNDVDEPTLDRSAGAGQIVQDDSGYAYGHADRQQGV